MYYIRGKDARHQKIYQRFSQYIDRNFKYIDNRIIKKIAGIDPAISYYLRNSAPNFSSTVVNTRLCASVTSSSVNVRSASK